MNKKRRETVNVAIHRRTHRRLKLIALKRGLSLETVVALAISNGLKKTE
jgi:predicted HicB family RNase H-like nuclease